MADCVKEILKNITSDCTTIGSGGNEVKGWLINRRDITAFTQDVTNPSKITAFTIASGGKRLWTFTGEKKMLNSGHDAVVSDTRPKKFAHYIGFETFEFDAESTENVDGLEDVVMIIESKDKTADGDGVFRIYGLTNGLFVSSDTQRANDAEGARVIEFNSLEGQGEPYSHWTYHVTDYAGTLADLVGKETPTV